MYIYTIITCLKKTYDALDNTPMNVTCVVRLSLNRIKQTLLIVPLHCTG